MTNLVERLRRHVNDRGGPAKDDKGNFIGTTWPMMLEAASELERHRSVSLKDVASWWVDAETYTRKLYKFHKRGK